MKLFRSLAVLGLLWPALAWANAPDIVLKDFDGKSRNVNEFVGKGSWTVVAIWAHDCHVCNAEMHQFEFFHDANKKKGASVLGVTIDGWKLRDKAKEFVDRHQLSFPNLIAEPEEAVMRKFRGGTFVGTPTVYLYGPDGKLVGRNIGPITADELEAFIGGQNAKGK